METGVGEVRVNRWRRAVTSLLAMAMTVATGVVVSAPPARADGILLSGNGVYGPNSRIEIASTVLTYKDDCDGGLNDFVYPVSDIYLVPDGPPSEGQHLDDVVGTPNAVVQDESLVMGEVIGITSPAGNLPPGKYAVVVDTCQDGYFDAADDSWYSGQIEVLALARTPAPDAALASLKSAALDEYQAYRERWLDARAAGDMLDTALQGGCALGNPVACALEKKDFSTPIHRKFANLQFSRAIHYIGIYADPPNPEFDRPVIPEKVDDDVSTDAMAGEASLLQALLRGVEAYKGAQQAGDGEWALVHAREVRDLHQALAGQLARTSAQLNDIKALFGEDADKAFAFAADFGSRVKQRGLTPDERRVLRESGLTGAQITEFENRIRAAAGPYTAQTVRDALAAQIAAHAKTAAAVQEGLSGWQAITDALAGDAGVPDTHPVAQAGGPYTAPEGQSIRLDGSASTAAQGATISSYAWDLDGDRDFDDAAGQTPSAMFDEPGSPVIGLRVSDDAGRVAYSWSGVTVTRKGDDPKIDRSAPESAQITVETGKTAEFSVTVSDDGGAPEVSWAVDRRPADGTESLSWKAPDTPGSHEVVATATDADGHRVTRGWSVLVFRKDADGDGWTATTDCDDSDAAVHPGQIEFIGNGVDDDCDSGSPDAPPGGLTAKPYGWGHNTLGQVGTGTLGGEFDAPQQTVLPGTAVQVESGFRVSFAVLSDGTVRAWGMNDHGQLGDGSTVSQRATPVSPLGVGGAGTLAGVTRISAHGDQVAAVRTDGTVATWGFNGNGQLGDGSTMTSRNVPGLVLTGPDTPLRGVRDIEAGEQAFYALMDDGTVTSWGVQKCLGTSSQNKPYATAIPGLSDIRQIAAASGVVFFLKKDGTLLSCGDTDPVLGRPWALNTPTSPYLPNTVTNLGRGSGVVDVSSSGDSAVALKEDGSVSMWGQNTNHELDALGFAGGQSTSVPTSVALPEGAPVVAVDHDDSMNTLAIRADGSMLAWGGNLFGATGTGGSAPVGMPAVVNLPGRVFLQVSASKWNALALTRPASDPDLELPASWVNATVEDAALSEADDGAFIVKLDHALGDDVALTWSLRPGSAGEDDATLGTGTVVVSAGETQASIPVDVADDAIDEDDETVTLALTGARLGLTITRAQATGTIADNDEGPVVSVEPATVTEGGTSLTDTPITFHLSKPSGKEVVAAYATADGSAKANDDYVASDATIRFAPGETEHVVHLAVNGDAIPEADETFTVSVGEVANGSAGQPATMTIRDDEVLGVSVSAPRIAEGTSGDFTVTVNPAPPAGESVSVPWSIVEPAAGPDDGPGDVGPATGTLTLTSEHPSGVVTATAIDDTAVESPEPFRLKIGAMTASDGRKVLPGEVGMAWITDNDKADRPPVVEAGDGVSGVEGAALPLSGTVTDDAAGVTSSWTVDGPCDVTGDGPQASVTCSDDGVFTATLTAVDAEGASASDTTILTVGNAAPVLGTVAVDGSGARIEFSDPGIADQHTCTVRWGDGTAPGVLDGALSPCFLPHTYGPGTFTATVTVSDGDGGSVSTSRTVKVASAPWPFRGFLPPVDNPPTVNAVQAGQAIPVKFGLGGYRGMDVFAAGSPASGQVSCSLGQTDSVEQAVTAGGSPLSYDAAKDQYTYVWKTDKAWAGQCRRLNVTLADGTQHWALFRFR
ncbi:hypothetical protein FH610_024740 [Microbispora catharanthi]|uniref:Calx-beta domain-containing protein n=2 Tax=Microbispora catharanthi TaxID=1712871 RepID=A0A5N6BNS7_9ACTN|nr:hypothetical protein FH610_024740 [Microbispora catharanthi]